MQQITKIDGKNVVARIMQKTIRSFGYRFRNAIKSEVNIKPSKFAKDLETVDFQDEKMFPNFCSSCRRTVWIWKNIRLFKRKLLPRAKHRCGPQ